MKKITYTTLIIICIVPATALHAEERGMMQQEGNRPMREMRMEARDDVRDIRQDAREDRREIRREGVGMMVGATSSDARMKARAEMKVKVKENAAERKEAVENRRSELKKEVEKKKVERKDEKAKRLDEKAQKRVGEKLVQIYKKLTERVDRLSKTDIELQTRIDRRTAAGINTSTAQGLLATARIALAKAKVDVDATKAIAITEVMSTTTKETFKTLVTTAEASVKSTAESYRKVIDAVAALPKPAVASSTPANVR